MKTLPSEKASPPLGSYEFGALMLVGLFAVPLAIHLLASLSL